MQVMAQKTKEAEITEQDSLLLTRNLLRIAIYNISYIRGLFPEKYFNDKSVPALEMKIKKLMPMDAESRRLIDWMEKGVYDALQKKYLKTLLFCICEKEEGPMIEEYAIAFSYPSKGDEVAMNLSRTGSKKNSATFKSNTAEVTPDQMRSSACKMIRTLVSLMRTLDQMPDERTIVMKLLYYDDVTPNDYKPPFFKGCADNEAINIWNKNPLKMEVGSVNSKHLVLALKVKTVLDPCEANDGNSEDDNMSLAHESDQNDDLSDTEVRPSEADRYVVAPNDGNHKDQSGSVSEEDTQDPAHEEEITAQVREWICSTDTSTVNASVVLSNFPDISMEMVEDILEKLLKDGVLSRANKDSYAVNKVNQNTSRSPPTDTTPSSPPEKEKVSTLVRACSREEDTTERWFGRCVNDVEPRPFDPADIYQQIEIIQRGRGQFTAREVALNGIPYKLYRSKYWYAYASKPTNFHLTDVLGINTRLRSRQLADATTPSMFLGQWYCPFYLVKEDGLTPPEQLDCAAFYEVTLEQRWEPIRDDAVSSRVLIGGSVVARQEVSSNGSSYGNGYVWFRSPAMGQRIGLATTLWERMRWEQYMGGWVDEETGWLPG